MSTFPAPVGVGSVFSMGWLMSRAFARNGVMAVLAYPLAVLTLVPYAGRRQLYRTDDGDGAVVFGPYRPAADAVLAVLLVLPIFAAQWLLPMWIGPGFGLGLGAVLVILVVAGVVALGGSTLTLPAGPETPKGDRWQVAGLAQRPGTRLSALQLALRLRETVPSGAILVAVAANDRLLTGYKRLGFSEGRQQRVYWEAPHESRVTRA